MSDPNVYKHVTACEATPFLENEGVRVPWETLDYCNKTSFFGGQPALPVGAGYGIVLGFGLFFSLFTTFLVWLDRKYVGTVYDSEQFNTAGRDVKVGLTASVIVSQWTWAATLLQSSNVAYQFGISGPFWYASGATIQIFLFGILAVELKKKAPTAHTMCEIILARWGYTAHKVFLCFALLTNIIVTAMLLLGGAAVVNALTGMNIYVASFLIPIGVILYTVSGGLKATFLASYTHTASDELGSPEAVYNRLQAITTLFPVEGNEQGSYVTMLSSGGAIFGIINIVGNFGTVFLDQSYWQSAIAAKPSASAKGYILGGFVWFCIPAALGTSLGMSCLALDLPVTASEAGAGLVPPAAAVHFAGQSGAVAVSVMLFMAVTSTGSAELIAVSSLFVYDVYRVYINPKATSDQILYYSRVIVVVFGVFMGTLAVVLNLIGLNLGWVYLFMGVLIGSAVVPAATVLLWSKATSKGAISGAVIGQILGIGSWLITAASVEGEITIATLGGNMPMLVGNVVAILSGALICIVVSLLNPSDYDWSDTKTISLVDQSLDEIETDTPANLEKASKWVIRWGVGFTVIIVILWPVLSIPAGVFSPGYYTFWVIITMIWSFLATFIIIALPLYESRRDILGVLGGIFGCKPSLDRTAPQQEKVDDDDSGSEAGPNEKPSMEFEAGATATTVV